MSNSLAEPQTEYKVKAAFLYNFSQFVEWPEESFESTNGRMYVCVYGQDLFGNILEKTFATKVVNNRRFLVFHDVDISVVKDCHVLFIGSSNDLSKKGLRQALQKSHALTVGETEHFIERGGMIRFYLSDGKVRFAVNPVAVEHSMLNMSSKLLRLAKIVTPE